MFVASLQNQSKNQHEHQRSESIQLTRKQQQVCSERSVPPPFFHVEGSRFLGLLPCFLSFGFLRLVFGASSFKFLDLALRFVTLRVYSLGLLILGFMQGLGCCSVAA